MLFHSPSGIKLQTSYICDIIIFIFEDICAIAFIIRQCFSYITYIIDFAGFFYLTCRLNLPLDCSCEFFYQHSWLFLPLTIRQANSFAEKQSLCLSRCTQVALSAPDIPHLEVIFSI